MLQNISHLFLDGTGNVIFGNSSSEERMGGIVWRESCDSSENVNTYNVICFTHVILRNF